MLSYQHGYHAGNSADVHKHQYLSLLLTHLIQKERPIHYFETHAGCGLYDLQSREALKTNEAKSGIYRFLKDNHLPALHPYLKVLEQTHSLYGKDYYPGSPKIAELILRECDKISLMELHPQEVKALKKNIKSSRAAIHYRNGYEGVLSLIPPTPRAGVIFIDPSFEVKKEYDEVVSFIQKAHQKWPQGIILLWYPILKENYHDSMIRTLHSLPFPDADRHEIIFDTTLELRIKGSGLLIINKPYGFEFDYLLSKD